MNRKNSSHLIYDEARLAGFKAGYRQACADIQHDVPLPDEQVEAAAERAAKEWMDLMNELRQLVPKS